jgi:hypothetical protein
MKKQISTVVAALLLVCFLVELAPTMINHTGLALAKWDSWRGRNGFYFKRRQWMADLRTVMAAIRFLSESQSMSPTNSWNLDRSPTSSLLETQTSTNLLGTNGTASILKTSHKGLARAERTMRRCHESSLEFQSQMFAFAKCSFADSQGRTDTVWV